MQNRQIENTATLYKNPFDDYNANVLDPEMIMRYWCTPFNMGPLKNFSETNFFVEKMPIILQGSRGSGKTTILKYFSFPVQCARATQQKIPVIKQLINDHGVGFYLRCDDSFLNMFKTVFKSTISDENAWLNCFNHYLELFFVQNLITMIKRIKKEVNFEDSSILTGLDFLSTEVGETISSLDSFELYINSEIRYINQFKNDALFTRERFKPKHFWEFYQISGPLIETIHKSIPGLKKINFLLLIDEFENLPIELQKMFNNMIKFCKTGMSLRIGRRSENQNIVTTATVNNTEYLREGNDYQLIVLDGFTQDIKEFKTYLAGVAAKRLESFEGIDISYDISRILGEKEDLDKECLDNATADNTHLEYILKGNEEISRNNKLCQKIISIISYPTNRIAETLCALWVVRNKEKGSYLDAAQYASDAMHAYFEKSEHPGVKKFKSDYNNKYRYALTCVICAAYKKEKLYYSFNTLSYLSEGNTRTFINLCKTIINDALFYEKKQFVTTQTISARSQNRAIREYALSEFNSVCSIIQNGKSIKNLILQIGNVLSEFHKDRKVRYPETTQFIYQPEELNKENRKILDVAESWALIKRREKPRRLSVGIKDAGYLYTINCAFTPIFNLSYRIRGGYNITFSPEDIDSMISGMAITKLKGEKAKDDLHDKRQNCKKSSIMQLSLFGEESSDE